MRNNLWKIKKLTMHNTFQTKKEFLVKMDSKDKVLAEALDLLNEIGFNVLEHEHTCFDEDDQDYQCYCGVEEILNKIANLNKRARVLRAKSETSS